MPFLRNLLILSRCLCIVRKEMELSEIELMTSTDHENEFIEGRQKRHGMGIMHPRAESKIGCLR